MAKNWMPSKKAISRYNELVSKNNELREQLLVRRRKLERQRGSSSLPDLVIPESQKKLSARINYKKLRRIMNQKEFWKKMRELSAIVTGGLEGWYKRNYKNAILQAWRDALDKQGFVPDAFGGKIFSKEYIERYPEYAEYFEAYNRLFRLSIGAFMEMYDRHMFPEFKYIYLEMIGRFAGEADLSPIIETLDSLKNWRKLVKVSDAEEHEIKTESENDFIVKQQKRLQKSKEQARRESKK